MKKILSIIFLMGIIGFSVAQGDYEALRFSMTDYMGTARFMGAGGAFSATGGDFSVLSTNPAGIGLFKRSEVSFTPMALSFDKDQTSYNGSSTYTQNPKYVVPQCGIVIASPIRESNWKMWQFGFGYNRIMDYNNTFRVEGRSSSTMIAPILAQAGTTPFEGLTGDALLAWETWLIDTISGTNDVYYSPFSGHDVNQSALVKRSGAIDEMTFAFGGNFNDKLYIGATIGIPFLDYTETTTFREAPANEESLERITHYTMTTVQQDKSTGINLKLGIIYQPVDFMRIGAAFHTPTYFAKVRDSYYRSMVSYYDNGKNSGEYSYQNRYDFTLATPLKFNVSTSFIINKRAFIAAEYEFCDYSMAKLYANDYNFSIENNNIEQKYGIVNSVRVGGEVNVTPKFVVRAGYNFKSSPYKLVSNAYNASAHYASVGLGYRSKYMFFDLGYVLRFSKDSYWLYDDGLNTGAEIANTTHRIVATIGCKF